MPGESAAWMRTRVVEVIGVISFVLVSWCPPGVGPGGHRHVWGESGVRREAEILAPPGYDGGIFLTATQFVPGLPKNVRCTRCAVARSVDAQPPAPDPPLGCRRN